MWILLWLFILLASVIGSLPFRLWLAVKKSDKERLNKISDIIVFGLIISLIITAVVVAVTLKTTLSYMYVCAAVILLVMNIIFGVLLYFLRRKEM